MTIDEKLDLLLKQSEDTNNKITYIENKVNNLEIKMDNIEAKVNNLETKVNNLETKVNNIEAKVNNIEAKVSSIELTLENETNRNIQIIADGHLDLSRKLDDTLKIENEKEVLLIRVNSLENEVRRIKERLSQIA